MNNKSRKLKRREGLQRNNDDEKRKKEKEKEKRQHKARPVKKIRMLKDGSIGLGHNFKLGRTGLYVIIGIIAGLILFMGGINGWYDQFEPDVKKEKFVPVSFEYCNSIDFNDDYCALEYKFCRTYEDGQSVCLYAEEDPFVNVDPNEKKYTEDEQDFLPPIINDFIFGLFPKDAHAEPRNHFTIGIYKSNSCKALTSIGSDTCPSNELLVESFDNTNQAISGKFIWSDDMNDVYRISPSFMFHQNFYQYSGIPIIIAVDPDTKWFNCCMDVQIFIEPSNFVFYSGEELSVDTTRWNNSELNNRLTNEQVESKNKIPVNEDDLDGDGILNDNDLCPNKKEDFNGYKDSDGCPDDIDNDGIFGNKCLTKEYQDEYKRAHKNDENPDTRVVPANCFIDLDECPNEPENYNKFQDDDGCPDLKERNVLTTHKNIYIEGCAFARVTANMTLITEVINYFWNQCEGKSPEITEYTYIPQIPINYDDHVWYKYNDWLNKKTMECKLKC